MEEITHLKNNLQFANEKLEQQRKQNEELAVRVRNNSEEIEKYKNMSKQQLSQVEHLEKHVRLPSNRVQKAVRKVSYEDPIFSKLEDDVNKIHNLPVRTN